MTRFTVQVLRLALPAALVMLCPACRLPWSAPAPPPRVEAGRSIAPPRVDGRCDDPAYSGAATLPLEDPSGRQAGRAHVLHDGLDLFVCVDGLDAAAARRATVRLDPVVAGGSPAALELTGDLEQRVDLSRVGGFGRSVGLAVSVDQAAWPSPRGEARTGELVLGPTYSAAPAGSVFVDGRRGFLAIPGAAALHPSELTVEAWVRPAEGACGALLSGGAGDLYLGLCGSLAYGPAGRASAVTTRTQLDGGWHHLAVTVDRGGLRTAFFDGEVVSRSGLPEKGEGSANQAQPAPSAGALRIGSDAAAAPGEVGFRGNVRELRLWRRARTPEELRAAAFTSLTGHEPDLVALWPFVHDLRDLAGGHDAGLVGTAALARDAPDVTGFQAPVHPSPPAYQYPPLEPRAPWAPQLLAKAAGEPVQVDGRCDDPAYAGANQVLLEPDRQRSVSVLLADDALYVCAHPVPGRAGGADGLTFLFALQQPVAVHLSPDGALAVTGPGGAALPNLGISGQAVTAPALPSGQEDVGTIGTPWWSGELRVPWQAIAGFQVGMPLRLGVVVDGSVPLDLLPADARAGVDPRSEARLSSRWPAQLDPASPATWGQVPTGNAAANAPSTMRMAPTSPRRTGALNAGNGAPCLPGGSGASWPRPRPTVADFHARCPTIKGTVTISLFGVKVKTVDLPDDLPYAFDRELKWPHVDGCVPMVQVAGELQGIELSPEDSPFIHTSHDLDMVVRADWGDSWEVLDDPSLSFVDSQSLVAESENGGVDFSARPLPGDHVTMSGRWIFDCGHSPKTEVHPLPYIELDRVALRPTGVGPNQNARLVRAWLNNDPGAFTYSLAPFTFNVEFPREPGAAWPSSHGTERFLRVRNPPGASVTWSTPPDGTSLQVTVTPATPTTRSYFELYLGYIDAPRSPAEVTGTQLVRGPNSTMIEKVFTTYTVTLEGIDITDDLDHVLNDSDHKKYGIRGSGKWHLDAIINGTWRGLMINQAVVTGGAIDLARVGPVTTLPGQLVFEMTGFANADPFRGPSLGSSAMNRYVAGDLKTLCCDTTRTLSPPDGKPWRLRYHVSAGGDVPALFEDGAYWTPRLADNDQITTSLGVLHVDPGGAPQVVSRDAYITEPPLRHDDVLLDPDVDGYHFGLDDFAEVDIAALPSPLVMEQTPFYDYEGYSSMPPELQAIVGYGRNYLKIHSATGNAGEVPYTLRITTRSKRMDPDWGAAHDSPGDGRAVDLRTPDPRAAVRRVTSGLDVPSETRSLQMPWAWQHVPGETHYYRVSFPAPTPAPRGHAPCEYDTQASLVLDAGFMSSTLLGDPGEDRPLTERFPTGQVVVKVENKTPSILGNRGVYRFTAAYSDAAWLTPKQCDTVRKLVAKLREVKTPFPVAGSVEDLLRYALGQTGTVGTPGGLPPGPGTVDVGPLGHGWAVQLGDATRLDTVLSGAGAQRFEARLYDSAGVLVGRGTSDERGGGSHLSAGGLAPGETYVLQAAPTFDVSREGATPALISFRPR